MKTKNLSLSLHEKVARQRRMRESLVRRNGAAICKARPSSAFGTFSGREKEGAKA
jgi:hypothetical protein